MSPHRIWSNAQDDLSIREFGFDTAVRLFNGRSAASDNHLSLSDFVKRLALLSTCMARVVFLLQLQDYLLCR